MAWLSCHLASGDAGQLARQMGRGEVRAASIAWPTRDELTKEHKQEAEREERGRKLRDALTYNTRQGGTLDQVRGLLSPAGRELVDALGAKIDREFRGTDAERDELKLHGVRKLAEKEVREGPVDPAYVRRQAAAWEASGAGEGARGRAGARGGARAGTVAAGVARSDRAGPGQPWTRHVARGAGAGCQPGSGRRARGGGAEGLSAGCLPRSRPGGRRAGQAD